jgi:hypothetical protein
MKLSLLTLAIIGLSTQLNAATFASNLAAGDTGNWNDVATWTFTGVDENGIPDENDNVNMSSPDFVPFYGCRLHRWGF